MKSIKEDPSTSWHVYRKVTGGKKRALFGHCHCLSVNNERGGDNVKLNVPSKKCCDGSLLACLLAEGCVVVIRAADHNPILVVSSSIRDIDNHKKVRIGKCQTVDFNRKRK